MLEIQNPYAVPQSNLTLGTKDEDYGEVRIFTSNGRIGRLRYLIYSFGLSYGIAMILGILVATIFGAYRFTFRDITSHANILPLILLGVIFLIAILPPMFLTIQRFHDLGRSGWYILLFIIPLLNVFLALILLFRSGDKQRNDFGAPPPPNGLAIKIIGGLMIGFIVLSVLANVIMVTMTRS